MSERRDLRRRSTASSRPCTGRGGRVEELKRRVVELERRLQEREQPAAESAAPAALLTPGHTAGTEHAG